MGIKYKTIFIISFFLLGSFLTMAGNQPNTQASVRKIKLPDLTATIHFKIVTKKDHKGKRCYTITPTFYVYNKGKAAAKGFKVIFEWKSPHHKTWQLHSQDSGVDLEVNKNTTYGNSASWNLSWCIGEKQLPAYRIRLDTDKKVFESNENNNEVIKTFIPPRRRLNRLPPRKK